MRTFRPRGKALILGAVWLLAAQAQPLLAGQSACSPHEVLALQQVLPDVAVVHGRWPMVAHTGIATTRAEPLATTVVLGQGPERTVVDPGPSQKVGLALRDTLMCQQGARVTALVNTHAHAEQVLGNSALAAPVMALAGTAQAMQERCPQCLASLTHELGETAMQGTRIVLPLLVLHEGQWLQAGGRSWWVQEMRRAHTEHDLVLWSPSSGAHSKAQAKGGVVLAGGLVDGRWPVLAQGSVLGWLQALDRLKAMQPDWLIGQHLVAGPSQVQSVLQRQHGYLCGILAHAWRRLEQGQSEAEGMQDLAPPVSWPSPEQGQANAWQQQHVFNQRRAWREAEQMWLDRQAWPNTCGSVPDVGR
jgi:glyoxylase-like metal-dependent hydrolase (beta-lactamase superfamily II)